MILETQTRTFVKTVSYRTFGTLTTTLFVLVLTGQITIAATIGGLEVLSKLVLFYIHERVWTKISFGRKEVEPAVIWITGLSGSQKTELAKEVFNILTSKKIKSQILNGENIRSLIPNIGFSRNERIDHIKRVGYFASLMEKNGIFTVCSFISPDHESRAFIRGLCRNFIEIHISTSIEECRKNDDHGIYSRADRGEIQDVAGVHFPYEESTQVQLTVDLTKESVQKTAQKIVKMCGI